MTEGRPPIPAGLRRQVLIESGHRCAIPQCSHSANIDVHHIIPWSECKKHEFDNLIVLCPNCHRLVHDGKIDKKSLKTYKSNLKNARFEGSSSNASVQSRLDYQSYEKLIRTIPTDLFRKFKNGSFGDHKTMVILQPLMDFVDACEDPAFIFKSSEFETEKRSLLDSANYALSYIRPYLDRDPNGNVRIGPTEGALGNDLEAMTKWSDILAESTHRMFEFFNKYNRFVERLTSDLSEYNA